MHTRHKQTGFTLIEMIVSLGVFATVITIAVGSLLVLVAANEQLQDEQVVMTNLSFALDSMTREIRTGTRYHCESAGNDTGTNNIFNPSTDLDEVEDLTDLSNNDDCPSGRQGNQRYHGVVIVESGNSITDNPEDRILYFHDRTAGQVYRRISNDTAVPIVSGDIFVHEMEFVVTGIDPESTGAGTYDEQPAVTIFLEASTDEFTPAEDRYRLQTTVTQRTLDL